jgi:2-oxoglutarate ferredoxin oxidoreductase subunit alpha
MPVNELSFRIGGEAGQGVESSGAGFCKALTRGGLFVLGVPDYYSRIRGGHNFFTIRVAGEPVLAMQETIHLLLALNAETITRHVGSLAAGGAIIVDESTPVEETALQGHDVHLLRLPMNAIAEAAGDRLMANTAMLAAAAGLTSFDLAHILSVLEDNFRRKGDAVVQANRRVAQAAYDLARERYGAPFPWSLQARPCPPRLTLSGNQAFAMGALMGGCKFAAGYPMTPATPVLEYLAQHAAKWGLLVKHAESETAAANMVVGAAHAGVRALAPTSGGGFDLMTEALSLGAMIETPVVIYLAQRPGPSTGLPTRTAQGDLFLAMHASHGEFPRIILAPHTPEESFACAARAFNLAEKYQCEVIVLSDHYLCGLMQTAEASAFDFAAIQIERGKLLSPAEVDALPAYKRYAVTEDGVSPRALPGQSAKAVFLATSDEHTEAGNISEDPVVVVAQMSKRLRKLETARAEMRAPITSGPAGAELTLVTWGSSYGAAREAIELLNARGASANLVQFVDLWPFPVKAARQALAGAKRIVVVEGNATAQFAQLLSAQTGLALAGTVLRFDGRAFTPRYILDHLEQLGLVSKEVK